MSDVDPQLLMGVVGFLKERCEETGTVSSFQYEFAGSQFKVRSSIKKIDDDGLWSYATIEIIRITK